MPRIEGACVDLPHRAVAAVASTAHTGPSRLVRASTLCYCDLLFHGRFQRVNDPAPSPPGPEPGRIARPHRGADKAGWQRWLPGLQTLRSYELSWLGHDIAAGLVLTTMLVPVGIAYAVASGVPGIYGLYATIVPLAGLCVVRPQPHPGAGPRLVAGGAHPRRRAAAVRRRPDARHRAGRHDGHRLRQRVHPGRRGTPGLRHRTVVQADPLRLHERHCADGVDQPVAQAVRLLDRQPRAAEKPVGHRHGRVRRPRQRRPRSWSVPRRWR